MVLLLRHKIYTLEVFDGTLMLLGICALYAFLVRGDVLLGVTVTSSYTSLWWCLLSFRALDCFLNSFLGNISCWWCVVDCTFLSGWIRYKRLLKRHFYLLCYRLSLTEFFLFPFSFFSMSVLVIAFDQVHATLFVDTGLACWIYPCSKIKFKILSFSFVPLF